MNSVMLNISPGGWGPADMGGNVHFWEYDIRTPSGAMLDISQRVSWARQLDAIRGRGDHPELPRPGLGAGRLGPAGRP